MMEKVNCCRLVRLDALFSPLALLTLAMIARDADCR
jgi:hypothetical protein